VADTVVALLDASGQWTHRDRQRHHRFEFQVPDGIAELEIRFRWGPKDLGSEHEANAISMALFDPNGFRGTGAHLAEAMRIGESVANPGFLAGPLPAGVWTIVVSPSEILNDGAETGYFEYDVGASATLAGGPGDQKPATARVFAAPKGPPPGDGPRWYRGDLHAHTTHSDGTITIEDRVRGAVERGQDFLAITDHNTISHHREQDRWPDVITPIRASEVTTFNGHMNCYGLSEWIDWYDATRGGGPTGIIERAHRQGALISINHPSAFGNPWCSGCHWDYTHVDYTTIDAIEVWNGRWAIPESDNIGALALWTDLLDAGFRPTAISGTDSHGAEEDGYVGLGFNHVYANDRSEASILDGIRRGRVFLSSGPILSFRARGSDGAEIVLPGEQLPTDGVFDLTVDVEKLEAPATLWYVTSGSAVPLGACEPGSSHVVRDGLVANKWWRLELRNGSAANGDILVLTNPVYMTIG
jgi:hypothetical protein